ncbi:MAG TPA: ABC transporter permease, partial [Bryobacteraceae bacterium]|nr:ABC transporter permease [Bryobacteraceae bacterium]
ALLLRPLPIAHPGQVVCISSDSPSNPFEGLSYPDYRDVAARAKSYTGVAASDLFTFGFAPAPNVVPQMRLGAMVSGNFFHVLGVTPVLGRDFLPEETKVPGRNPVAILGYDLWKSEFGRDRGVIGRSVRIDGLDFTVVGVAPESFSGTESQLRLALYVPLMMKPRVYSAESAPMTLNMGRGQHEQDPLENRESRSLSVRGRLKPGVSIQTAQAEATNIAKDLERAYPATNRDHGMAVRTEIQARLRRDPYDAALVTTLMALAGVVLLIACANVANLLLARARGRSREIAIRLAIGAGRGRLIRQLLTESLLLAAVGCAFGLVLADLGILFLQRIKIPSDLPIVISVTLDHRVLIFSIAAAMLSALVFGLAPAWNAGRTDVAPTLRANELASTGKQRAIGRSALVVAQVALSVVLLVAAGMLLDGFRKSLSFDPGFRTDHLLTMEFDTSFVRYSEQQTRDFYRNLLDRARALPGVRSATLAQMLPFSPNPSGKTVIPEGYQFPKGQDTASLLAADVADNYFDTMKMHLIAGRSFNSGDRDSSRPVVIVNEEFARHFWPGKNPIGRRVRLNDANGPMAEVVGETKQSRYMFIAEPPFPFLYVPWTQDHSSRMTLIVESYGDPAALAAPLRDVVRALDPNQPIYDVHTMSSYYQQREISIVLMISQMVATMGLLGLTLALVGLYGLIAYSVSRRTQEIGVRMAIGASRVQVLKMVLRQGLVLAAVGIVIGSVASLAVRNLLSAGLIGLGSPTAAVLVIVPVALLVVTMLACYIPAYRASRIDPLTALRYE